jgi:hypothetical protein
MWERNMKGRREQEDSWGGDRGWTGIAQEMQRHCHVTWTDVYVL